MMTSAFLQPLLMAVARHLATAAGGALAANGMIAASEAQTVSGAILALVGVAFSAYDKYKKVK